MGRRSRARPRTATRPPVTAGGSGARRDSAGQRLRDLFDPHKKSRVRAAAAMFAALSLVLVVLGLLLNRAYFQPALLTAILALLWGARSATMR
jgi:hypothetical protein